jgi:hypothetical protein
LDDTAERIPAFTVSIPALISIVLAFTVTWPTR